MKNKALLFIGIISAMLLVPFGASCAEVSSDALANESFSAYLTTEEGTVLYEKAATERHEIASMTKIMTLDIVFREIDEGRLAYDQKICVSETAAAIGGSTMLLDKNSEHTVESLVKGVAVASANDAAVALAEAICGTEQQFVAKMNDTAAQLGMNETNFVNCTGLPAEGQFSCAKDVNAMTRDLLKHKDYLRFAGIKYEEYTHPGGRITMLANTNKLLKNYEGCDAGKTGYTDKAGHCLSASAVRNGMRVISTVIGAKDSKARFRNASNMMNYAFNNYEITTIAKAGDLSDKPEIAKLKNEDFRIGLCCDVTVTAKKGASFEQKIIFSDGLAAPIKKGDKVGELQISKDGEIVKTVDIVALEDIEKAGFGDYIKKIASLW